VDVLETQSAADGLSEQSGQHMRTDIVIKHQVAVVLGVYSESPLSSCDAASHCNVHCSSSHLVPDDAQGFILDNSREI
jgi:hypothetical protein